MGPNESTGPGYAYRVAKTNATPAKGRTPAKGSAAASESTFLGGNRWDRVIGGMFFGIMVLSVVAFILLMVGSATGFLNESNKQFYAPLLGIPYFGLPIALILLVVLVVRMAMRRRRENARA